MVDNPIHPVVIVGAGPTGVAVATLLSTHGVSSLVLDRWPGVYPQPRAVHLDDEVYRILTRMGVADAFDKISRPSLGLRLLDREMNVLAEFDRSGPSAANGHPRASMFDQPELETLLRRNLDSHPAVTLRGDVEVLSVKQSAGLVQVELQDRTTGALETVEGSFLLGCDGANSLVRETMGSRYEDLGFEQRWLVIDVECSIELDQWEGVHQVCATDRAATYMRVGATRYRWEFQLLDDERLEDFQSIDDLAPLIAPWTGQGAEHELELIRVAEYTFRAKVADRWRDGRLFLLGDAAHLTPPFIGQGMGAGLRDAANLSWRLAGVLQGALSDSVLDGYEEERKPHARALVLLAKTTGIVMTRGGRLGDLARRFLAPQATRVPGLRRRLTESETPRLRVGERLLGPGSDRLAGRLVPNSPATTGGVPIDSVAGSRWCLVSLDPLAPSEARALARAGCLVIETSPLDPLGAWLSSARVRAALVRPDRTVQLSHRRPSVVAAMTLGCLVHGRA